MKNKKENSYSGRTIIGCVLGVYVLFNVFAAATAVAQPVNDHFAQREPLPALPFDGTANLLMATREPGEPPSPSSSTFNIWFKWTAPGHGWLHLKSQYPFVFFDIFTGDALELLESVPTAFENGDYFFEAHSGVTYQIALASKQLPPDHQAFAAVPLSARFDPVPQNPTLQTRMLLEGASGEVIADGHLITGHTLWYEWIAPTNGTLLQSLARADSAPFYGIARLYVGDDPSNLIPLENPAAGLVVTQGMSIKLSVYAPFPTRVIWQFFPVPVNDFFARAESFTGNSVQLTGQNHGAGREAREPKHGADFAGRSIWYRWTAPTNGWATWYVTTPGHTPSTRVYEGTNLSRLKRVINQSQINSPEALFVLHEFQAVAGKTYCFVVDNQRTRSEEGPGYHVNPAGTFDMQFTFTTLQLNAELSAGAGAPALLSAGFVDPDPATVSDVSAAQYGLVYLDRLCPGFPIAGNEPGGLLRWTNPPPGRYLFYGVVSNQSGGSALLRPVNLLVPPPNDNVADAEMVEGFEFSRVGIIAGSGREPREPTHGDAKGLGSIWWKWTAPADGFAELGLTIYGHRFGHEPSDRTGITPSLAAYVHRNGKLVRIAGARRAKYTVGCRLQVKKDVTYFIAGQMPKRYYLSGCEGNAELRLRLNGGETGE